MPTTPTYNLPYPQLDDAPNVPADLQALAEGVDTAIGTAIDGLRAELLDALGITMQSVALPEGHALVNVGVWEQWGSLLIPDPGRPVTVLGLVTAQGTKDGGALVQTYLSVRCSISLDGGSTYDAGAGPRQDVEGPGGLIQRGAVSSHHVLTGSTTGDVVVRAEHQGDAVAPNLDFYAGRLTAIVIPTPS